MERERLVYINEVGNDTDGEHIYHFLFSDTPDTIFIEDWAKVPACNVKKELLLPSEGQYKYIAEVRTNIKLILAQENCCFSMQDCQDGIFALCYEDICDYEQYPEPFRIVIHYGATYEEISRMFGEREISMMIV